MAEVNLSNERNSSINVSRTSKGVYSWDIKLYYDSEATDSMEIIKKLKELDTQMQKEFKSDNI